MSLSYGRGQSTRNRGRGARLNAIPAGNPRMSVRDQRRAYEHQMDRTDDWSEHYEFEPSQSTKGSRGPTSRSSAFKQNLKNKERAKEKRAPKETMAVPDLSAHGVESAPSDEPLYDLGPHAAGVAVTELYSQNFEFSGYIDLIERSYESFRTADPRVARTLPYSAYQHAMCNVLQCTIMDATAENGERKLDISGRMQDYLLDDQLIPSELYEYCTNIANITTPTGDEVRVNIPDAAVPQPGIPAAGNVPVIRSGSFGAVDNANHNAYECYISPLVTAGRVEASRDGVQDWDPLPPGAFPQGAIPTQDLLGYGPIDTNPEGVQRLQGIQFNEDGILGRFKISQELLSRVNTSLQNLKDQHKMVEIGIDPATKQRRYIKRKLVPSNLLFVEAANGGAARLSLNNVRISSMTSFGGSQAGQSNVTVTHRRRVRNTAGYCYTVNNHPPPGWPATINSNFTMVAPFVPTSGVDDPSLRAAKFISATPAGTRITSLDNYIRKNYIIKK